MPYTIGLDFGSDSVRALIVDASSGEEMSTSVASYSRWKQGKYNIPHYNQFRQHPMDYIDAMKNVIHQSLEKAGSEVRSNVIGIGVDTTGSTPCPVNEAGVPLALTAGFEENPNAMFHLWKDHTAIKEAEEINQANEASEENYLKYVGGIYSSEWYWAKILHTSRTDEKVRDAAFTWVEHCDWIPFLITGGTDVTMLKRSVCATGHKALWHDEYNGVPAEFLSSLDPLLSGFRYDLLSKVYTSDIAAGTLSPEWADQLGLSTSVVVAVGAYDAHMGAVGGEIEPGYLSKVIGTSTCDIMVVPLQEKEHLVKGICGQVNGSVIPGMLGMEAGQSAFGDVYAWFKKLIAWPLELLGDNDLKQKIETEIIPKLEAMAAAIEPSESDMISLDWMNGRRTPDADQTLKGVVSGINLGTDAPRVFKSLVEATCFGARRIVDRFIDEGVKVEGVIALGGVAKKSTYVMQTLSDILERPIRVGTSEQTCALGAAMFAATAAGKYETVEAAMQQMGGGFDKTYEPNPGRVQVYQKLYLRYCELGKLIESNK
jgi:L-ribulokinase